MAHTLCNITTSTARTGNPVVVNHTPGSPATCIIVGIVTDNSSPRSGGDPTVDGQALTQIGTTQTGDETTCELWYRADSFDGSQVTVSIPHGSAWGIDVEVVSIYAGSGNSTILQDNDQDQASGVNGLDIYLTAVAVGDFVYAVLGCGESSLGSISSNYGTDSLQDDMGQQCACSLYHITTGTGSQTVGWDWSNDDGNIVGALFATEVVATKRTPADNEGVTDYANRTMDIYRKR